MDYYGSRQPPPTVPVSYHAPPIPAASPSNTIPIPPPFTYPPPFPPPNLSFPPYPPPYPPNPMYTHLQTSPVSLYPPPYQLGSWQQAVQYQHPPPPIAATQQCPPVQQTSTYNYSVNYQNRSGIQNEGSRRDSSRSRNIDSRSRSHSLRNNDHSSRNKHPSDYKEERSSRKLTGDPDVDSFLSAAAAVKGEELSQLTPEEIIEHEKKTWTRCAPADLYYVRDEQNPRIMRGTPKLQSVIDQFRQQLIKRGEESRMAQPKFECPPRKTRRHNHRHCGSSCKDSAHKESEDSSSSSSSDEEDEVDLALQELERKKQHPARMHPELWYNDPGEMNDGPLCRCSHKAKRTGIRHGIYAGEKPSRICQLNGNNADLLHHYRVTISPATNFLLKRPTVIRHDEHEFIFEGFSLLSHYRLDKVPTCKVIRFNIEYTIVYIEEKIPDNFTICELVSRNILQMIS